MEQTGEDVKLDYNLLLLKHLDRLSHLSTTVQGELINSQGYSVHWKEKDRSHAFDWGVSLLQCIIPEDLRDKKFKQEIDEIKKEYNDFSTEEKNKLKNFNLMSFKELTSLVNLLSRRGYLYQNQGMMKLQRPDNEEWDQ